MMNTIERTSHASSAQVEALVEFLESNSNLAKGFLRTQGARERGRRQWEELSLRLNSMGGTVKTYKQWTKYWSDKKSATKKKAAARDAARCMSDGIVQEDKELSEVEERIISLLGGKESYLKHANLGIHPFEEVLLSTVSQAEESLNENGISDVPIEAQPSSPTSEMITDDVGSEVPENSYTEGSERSASPLSNQSPPTMSLTPSPLSFTTTRSNQYNLSRYDEGDSSTPLLCYPRAFQAPQRIQISFPTHPSSFTRSASFPRTASSSLHGNTSQEPREARRLRARHGARSSTSRPVATQTTHPSQRRTQLIRMSERFLRVEEQQLELQQVYARLLETTLEQAAVRDQTLVELVNTLGERIVERASERDRLVAEALKAVGEGLQAIANSIKRD